MFNVVLYGWTPDAFPASVRGSACGLASFWGRSFSIIAPIAGSHVLAKSLDGVLYLAGGSVWVCTMAIMLLPQEFMGRIKPTTQGLTIPGTGVMLSRYPNQSE